MLPPLLPPLLQPLLQPLLPSLLPTLLPPLLPPLLLSETSLWSGLLPNHLLPPHLCHLHLPPPHVLCHPLLLLRTLHGSTSLSIDSDLLFMCYNLKHTKCFDAA